MVSSIDRLPLRAAVAIGVFAVSAMTWIDLGTPPAAMGVIPAAAPVEASPPVVMQPTPDPEPQTHAGVPAAPNPTQPAATTTTTSSPPTTVPADVVPIRVRIPSIDVDAAVIDLAKDDQGELEVPTDFELTGWYTGRSVPGDMGPSVVVGHVDSKAGPAVFFRLRDLEPGHLVQIDRSDGTVATFRVTDKMLVDKDEFPTTMVYGATARPTLRLVTCGGDFDRSAGSYFGNVIVFAEHLGNYPAASATV